MAYTDQLTAEYGDRVHLHPRDEMGDLDLDALLGSAQPTTLVYCCGPEGLISAAEKHARQAEVQLHVERFVAGAIESVQADEGFEAHLVNSGLTVPVGAGESVLEAVEQAGVFVLSSCREGICGTCETRVVGGRVDHRDSYLTDEEKSTGDVMMICVSRSAGGELDLDL